MDHERISWLLTAAAQAVAPYEFEGVRLAEELVRLRDELDSEPLEAEPGSKVYHVRYTRPGWSPMRTAVRAKSRWEAVVTVYATVMRDQSIVGMLTSNTDAACAAVKASGIRFEAHAAGGYGMSGDFMKERSVCCVTYDEVVGVVVGSVCRTVRLGNAANDS